MKAIFAGVLAMALFMPVISMAVTLSPSIPSTGDPLDLQEIEGLIRQIARFLIIISLVVAVIFIVWGAISWMAGGALGKPEDAKAKIWNGIYGAAVVLAIGVILQTLAALIARTFFNFS